MPGGQEKRLVNHKPQASDLQALSIFVTSQVRLYYARKLTKIQSVAFVKKYFYFGIVERIFWINKRLFTYQKSVVIQLSSLYVKLLIIIIIVKSIVLV